MKKLTALRTFAATLAAFSVSAATADVSLTLTQTSAKCAIRGNFGGTFVNQSSDCQPGPEFLIINNTTRAGPLEAWIELTYSFNYSDDGFALPSPTTLLTGDYGGQVPSALKLPLVVSFESATLDVDVASSFGPNPGGPGYAIRAMAPDAPPDGTSLLDGYLVFGMNDHPDSFSGSITLRIGVTPAGLQDLAQVTSVEVSPSVAAIPEPSTYALLMCGLGLLALRRASAARALTLRST
jgi:PEP-CTERM motif